MKSDNALDNKIEDCLKQEISLRSTPCASGQCPGDWELADFLSGVSGKKRKQEISAHIMSCDRCFDIAASGLKVLSETGENQDKELLDIPVKKACAISKKHPEVKGKFKNIFKKGKYLFIAGVFFILSFIVKRYFLQFLCAAGIFGIKWTMDTGSTRALIMIYDAWKARKDDDSDRNCSNPRKNKNASRV
jgi:hypothetical protein